MWLSQDTAASPPGSSKEEDPVQSEWCVAPELHPFPQPFPSSCALAPVLPRGPCPLTADLNALLFSEEVVLLSITATIYKVLTVPSLGIVKVSDLWGNAGT